MSSKGYLIGKRIENRDNRHSVLLLRTTKTHGAETGAKYTSSIINNSEVTIQSKKS